MTKLSDLQCILLSAASARDDGSVYPLPQSASDPAGTARAVRTLLTRGLIEAREAGAPASDHRAEGDPRPALYITAMGLAAIGVEIEPSASGAGDAAAPPAPAARRETKGALVVQLLERACGATLPELIEATGWLPHTTRAALTGLRKKGHAIEKGKRDEATCYSIKAVG